MITFKRHVPVMHLVNICIFVALLSSCAMPSPPKRTALVYGISIYDTAYAEGAANSNNLTYPDEDAASMASMLSSEGWSVTAGIADSSNPANNADASRSAIEAGIAGLAGTDGLVLFYYSGHGSTINGESVIIPYGTVDTPSEWISVTELRAMFRAAGLHHVVIILDSCYSGGFVDSGATADAIPPIYDSQDPDRRIKYMLFMDAIGDAIHAYVSFSNDPEYVVLSAAGAGELSWESATYGHGIFSYYTLRAFTDSQADADKDGFVTTTELYAYVAAKIQANWNADYKTSLVSESGVTTQYADFMPHLSGTAYEYALWSTK